MWNNQYWGRYWGDHYWAPVGDDGTPVVPSTDDRRYVIGMGQSKTRAHPHPMFSRVKQ